GVVMSTVNKFLVSTGERVATFRITLDLTAEDIALALADSDGNLHGLHQYEDSEYDGAPAKITDADVRLALGRLFNSGLETASFRVGDNNADSVVEDYTAAVIEQLFDGRQYVV